MVVCVDVSKSSQNTLKVILNTPLHQFKKSNIEYIVISHQEGPGS